MKKMTIRNDLLFKFVFGRNTESCIQSLTWFLSLLLKRKIVDLRIMNPITIPETITQKMVVFDLVVLFNDGEQAIIEMQMKQDYAFRERFLYYLAKGHYSQNLSGEEYGKIKKTYLILIADFKFIPDNEIVHHYLMRDEFGNIFHHSMELITVELAKVKPDFITPQNIGRMSGLDMFFYYLKYCDDDKKQCIIEMIKKQEGAISMIDKTYKEISEDQREAFRKISEEMNEMKAFHIGMTEGIQKGKEEGQKQGQQKTTLQHLKSLIKKMTLEDACDLLEIPIAEAKNLLELN